MSFAPIALSIAGTALSAVSAVSQGRQAAAIGRYNQQLAQAEAARTREAAVFEERRLRNRVRALIGTQRAAAAAQGTTLEGSPTALIEEATVEAELDAAALRQAADAEAARFIAEGAIRRAEGRAARTRGFLKAGASVITGASDVIDRLDRARRPQGTTP